MAPRLIALAAAALLLKQCGAEEEVAPGTCMVQRKAAQISGSAKLQRKPAQKPEHVWDMHIYTGAGHHKAGVVMMWEIFKGIWTALGFDNQKFGVWIVPCYRGDLCYNWDAPVRYLMDFYSPEFHAKEVKRAGSKGVRLAGSVRNPLTMLASAYCYHHRGEETINVMFGSGAVTHMSMQEGLPYVAEHMSELIENMTGLYEFPREDTLRMSYEAADASSEGFDSEVNRLLDFWFHDVNISQEVRQKALDAARQADLHRNPHSQAHTNTDGCMDIAKRQLFSMPSELLARYQSFAKRLGYPYTEEEFLKAA